MIKVSEGMTASEADCRNRRPGPARLAPPSARGARDRFLPVATVVRCLLADLDPLEARDRDNLLRARADLRDATVTERLFDRLAIQFSSETGQVARRVYRVSQVGATLTAAAAVPTSLHWLHSYEPSLDAANGPVEQAVGTIRRLLGPPPPAAS